MSILKFVNGCHRSLIQMQDYLLDEKKTIPEMTFGIGINRDYPAEQMSLVQKYYYAANLINPYKQIIFSFDRGIHLSSFEYFQISYEIGKCLLTDKRQLFGAIHLNDPEKVHCHYMINWISIDGKYWRQEKSLYLIKKKVDKILLDHGLRPILIDPNY